MVQKRAGVTGYGACVYPKPPMRYELQQTPRIPPNIFILSSREIGAASSQSVPVLFDANGQSTENIMRSTPISIMLQTKALVEKLPLVVR